MSTSAETRSAHPDVQLSLHRMDTAHLLAALDAHEVDLAVLTARPEGPGIATRDLVRTELVVVLPLDHALAGRKTLGLAQLRAERLVMLPARTPRRTTTG